MSTLEEFMVNNSDAIASVAVGDDVQNTFVPVFKRLYIDLEALVDIPLGMLLTNVSSELQFNYVRHCAPKYAERLDDEILTYFPGLKISKKDWTSRFKKPDILEKAIHGAPNKTVVNDLADILPRWSQTNKTIDDDKRIYIFIGSGKDYPIPEMVKLRLRNLLCAIMPENLVITFINGPMCMQKQELLKSIDVYIFDDMRDFLRPGSTGHETMMGSTAFLNKLVISRPIIDREYTKKFKESDEELLEAAKTTYSIYCDFEYINYGLLR